MALIHEKVKEILDEKGPELLERIVLDEMFLSVLVKWKVISQSQRQNLEGKSRHGKIGAVLEVVRAGGVDQFDGLIEALKETNQGGVASILRPEAVYGMYSYMGGAIAALVWLTGAMVQYATNPNIVNPAPATAKGTKQTSAVKCVQAIQSNGEAASSFRIPEGASNHPVTTLTTDFGSMSLPVTPKRLEWHHTITPKLKAFHERHATYPRQAVTKARLYLEDIIRAVEAELRAKDQCIRFEFNSEKEIYIFDAEKMGFDMMAIAESRGLKAEPLDAGTKVIIRLKPKDKGSEVQYAKVLDSSSSLTISPEKAITSFFGHLRKALDDTGYGDNKVKLRRNGFAVQMDIFHIAKAEKWFSATVVFGYQVDMKLYAGQSFEMQLLAWRRIFWEEEKRKFKQIDDVKGCHMMCLRIIMAIWRPPGTVKRKPDSSFSHLTSTMIKTALFYENEKRLDWSIENLGPRTLGLISTMADFVDKGFFPDFFQKIFNILMGLESGPRDNLAKRLQRLVSSEVEFSRVIGEE